jgi:biopolymer transport protein ExbB
VVRGFASFPPVIVEIGSERSMLREMFERGGPVMWPLLAASVLSLALILERTIVFIWWFQRFGRVVRTLRRLILAHAWGDAEKWCRQRGPFTHVALVYLRHRDQPEKIREDVLKREGTLMIGHLEQRLRWLAALAQVSTLLGLLGTFYFMIYRFRPEATASGQVPQAEFFAAIWESFLSTMFGLIIAIPCTAAYQIFESRVDAVSRDLGVLVSYLDEWRRAVQEQAVVRNSSSHDGKIAADSPKSPV